jgi:streptogramin lyase
MASDFSYIWVANSPESTVSKIDTSTVQEVGRFVTRPTPEGNPSRTSVSISGRKVAVANRHGGVVAIWANQDDCDPNKNGTPGLQTSTSSSALPWDEDDCVAWYTAFDDWTVQRPIAWAPGVFNEGSCTWQNERVWTAGCGGGFQPGFGSGPTNVVRLNGDSGEIEDQIVMDTYPCSGFGPYGGAVDSAGNFWMTLNNGPLGFVDAETLEWTIYDKPQDVASYGMTIDAKGRPWVTSYSQTVGVARFDPMTQMWATTGELVGYQQSGIAQGDDGRIWIAGSFNGVNGIAGLDPETLAVTDIIEGVSSGKGVSGDGDGYIWRAGGSMATRFNPDDGTSTVYTGLNGAYTYSDMTGFGVANAAGCQPAG